MNLTGKIDTIIFKNELNGYTIAILTNEEKTITVVGYLPFIQKGDNVKLEGDYTTHKEYGLQFKIKSFEKVMPETLDELEKYLGNGLIKGIGKSTAKKIVKAFKEDTINVLKSYPEKLATIKGINEKKALSISESFNENWCLWEIAKFLEKFDIGAENAQKIYKALGADTIAKIESNPYILEDIGIRVDFAQMDKLALNVGIEKNSLKRIDSGILYALRLATYNGHTCVLLENLMRFTVSLLGLSNEDINDGLKDLKSKEKINIEDREEITTIDGKTEMKINSWVFLADYYKAEINIARKLKALSDAENMNKIYNIDLMVKKVSDIKPSEEQKKALEMCNNNNVCIITGGPGTGKTTIARIIGKIFAENKILSDENKFVEVDREKLVGKYVGWTASKTKEAVEEAKGGVLFVDEAYSLVNDDSHRDFGYEAIDTLIKEMEDNRDNLCVIFAGYTNEMEKLLKSNPGFESRIQFKIKFPDYTSKELYQVFAKLCHKEDYKLSSNIKEIIIKYFEDEKKKENFSNARCVRNLFEKVEFEQASRIVKEKNLKNSKIIREDVIKAIEKCKSNNETIKNRIGFYK